jgi:hypothetical protein
MRVGPRALSGLLILALALAGPGGPASPAGPARAERRAPPRPPVLLLPPPGAVPRAEPPPLGERAAAAPTSSSPAPGPSPAVPSDEAPEPEAPPSQASKKAKRLRLRMTVLPFPGAGVGEEQTVPLLRGLSEALQRNERLEMRDLEARLSDFAQEVPVDQVDLARTLYQRGIESLHQLELPKAIAQLQDAVDQLGAVLPYVRKQELADAMLALAVAHAQKGARRASNAALIRLLTWRADYELDDKRFPPFIAGPLEDARRAVSRLARGAVKIQSEPPGAQVFVDGRYAGVTPLTADGLLVGEHYVTFKRIGYKKGLRVAQVGSRSAAAVLARLQPSEKYLLMKQAMDRLRGALGAQRLGTEVDTLKETLYLDHAVLLRVEAGTGTEKGALALTAYLYDLRTRQLVRRHALAVADVTAGEAAMGELAERLYAGADYDNILKPPPEPPPPPPPVARTPLYRKWWFLTAAGAIVAGVVAIGVGVGATRPSGCPDGNVCTGRLQY